MMDTVYLTPTRDDPWDPYVHSCLFQLGKYNHKKITKVLKKMKKRAKQNKSTSGNFALSSVSCNLNS